MNYLALGVSFIALLFTYTSVVFGKNLEIRVKKFDELILNELKSKFTPLDTLFINNPNDILSIHLTVFTDIYVDITLYVIAAKEHFPGLNVDKIQDELQEFSDKLYRNSMKTISEEKLEYQVHKMRILCMIYDQSIRSISKSWYFIPKFW